MNPRTEKAIRKWMATDIIDRDINAFKDGRVELLIWDDELGTWLTIAKFTTRSIIQKRYAKRKVKKAKK